MPRVFMAGLQRGEKGAQGGEEALRIFARDVVPGIDFDQLARKFPHVVIVGADEDLRTEGTYFRREFVWPEHVQNFIGKLNLPDTAALLRACAALVSNDSGLMQLGVALGVPTFGIFGITSPAREAMRSKYFHAITKGLPCETACHAGKWGRRDCERHLEIIPVFVMTVHL